MSSSQPRESANSGEIHLRYINADVENLMKAVKP